jgi:ribonuclease P/MRP protein subunit RPP1
MLYDLNIYWTPSTSTSNLLATLRTARALGYDVVALNQELSVPLPQGQITNPLTAVIAKLETLSQPQSQQARAQPTQAQPQSSLPKILSRCTLALADPSANPRLSELARHYDILAVRPTSERAFQAACTTLPDLSILSVDLATFHAFHFRHRPVMAAVRRGVRLEVCYSQALNPAADKRARVCFIQNLRGLLRGSGGRGILVSSETRGAAQLRAPADVVNLLAVWGLGTERGTEGMSVVARGVVVNEGLKRRGFRGVVDIVQVAGDGSKPEAEEPETGKGKGVGKRKAGGDEEVDGDAPAEKPLSKRQQKKMKMAARAAASELS